MSVIQEGNVFRRIVRGPLNSDGTVSQGESKLKKRADIAEIHNAFEIGLHKAESLKFYDVRDVCGAITKWIRLPHKSQTECVKVTIKQARSSVKQVQELLTQVEHYLETYEGDTLSRDDRPPRNKEKMRSICGRHLKMMEVVLVALNEFESIFLNNPVNNQLAQQQAEKIYQTFILQRDAIYI